VLANDVHLADTVTVTIEMAPTNGTVEIVGSPGPASGISIRYTPDEDMAGIDEFIYRVENDGGNADTAVVTLRSDNLLPVIDVWPLATYQGQPTPVTRLSQFYTLGDGTVEEHTLEVT